MRLLPREYQTLVLHGSGPFPAPPEDEQEAFATTHYGGLLGVLCAIDRARHITHVARATGTLQSVEPGTRRVLVRDVVLPGLDKPVDANPATDIGNTGTMLEIITCLAAAGVDKMLWTDPERCFLAVPSERTEHSGGLEEAIAALEGIGAIIPH